MDDFITVKRKRGCKKSEKQILTSEIRIKKFSLDRSNLKRKIEESIVALEISEFLKTLLETIDVACPKVDEVICYGLGNFSECYVSRTQLALLLNLQRNFGAVIFAYDPLFSPVEIEILETFNIVVYKKNDEGKRVVKPDIHTLVYFPHCSKQLVNNFLWANWSAALRNCVLLSNSFSEISFKNTSKTLESISCLRDIVRITTEVAVSETFEINNVFNDLSVHTFDTKQAEAEFWSRRAEPVYSSQDIEFITKEIVVKLEIV